MKLLLAIVTFACVVSAAPIQEEYANRLADAIWAAEGGNKAKVPFGVLSVNARSLEHAREICLRTIRNSWARFEAAGRPGCFVEFLGKQYAPLGAANDPKGLNINWPGNVRSRLTVIKTEPFFLHRIPARRRNFSVL